MFADSPSFASLPDISSLDGFPTMTHNATVATFLATNAFWGPVTSTLDWCEVNYQFSRYIAELANSSSNIVTVALAFYGAAQSITGGLPRRFLVGWAGFALVGIGSFIFHATLLYGAQLMDELPMVYVASYCTAVMFDTTRGYNLRQSKALELAIVFTILNLTFTYTYYFSRNPIYHQLVFASLMFTILVRTVHLLRRSDMRARIPQAQRQCMTRLFASGALTFVFGFLVWNLDNIFCSNITRWKQTIGWPAAFFLEGHSWWHVFTAVGTYYMLIANIYLTLCIKEDHWNFTVTKTFGIPSIRRVIKIKAK